MNGKESYFNCRLPDGQTVNLMTCKGSNAFINAGPGTFISSNLEAVNGIRQKKGLGDLSHQDKEHMRMVYTMIDEVANNASDEVFATIPRSELDKWYAHCKKVLTQYTVGTKCNLWKKTGEMEEQDASILHACISMSKHLNAVKVAFESDFFKILANLIAAVNATDNPSDSDAPLLPCADIAESINFIVDNTRVTCQNDAIIQSQNKSSSNSTSNNADRDAVWKKFESNGLLLQFIRCSTIPQTHKSHGLHICYDDLIECLNHRSQQLKDKFERGKLCGELVYAMMWDVDGNKKRDEKVLTHIRNIAKILDIAQLMKDEKTGTILYTCRYCNSREGATNSETDQSSLMACGQCLKAYYCSRDCQRKDWKTHKLYCVPSPDTGVQT